MAHRCAVPPPHTHTHTHAQLGHVLGFYHPFLVASAPGSGLAGAPPAPFSAPADPLGPAPSFVAGASPYADSLDVMACCKSDYRHARVDYVCLSGGGTRLV